nr:GNAT family N-acetyltransferase [uncultured Roseateles sp.]
MSLSITLERHDAPGVAALIADLDAYQRTLYPPESCYLLDLSSVPEPQLRFAVARDAHGVAVACCALVFCPGYGELKRMFVRHDQRGLGLARQLLSLLEAEARQARLPLLRLETGPKQHEALALYGRLGYQRRGPYGDYDEDPFSVFMEKALGGD